jgi:predicted DNA-binding WGR domain protein
MPSLPSKLRMVNENNGRFYKFRINPDTCELMRRWGSVRNNRGGARIEKFQSLEELNKQFKMIIQKRIRHGYR